MYTSTVPDDLSVLPQDQSWPPQGQWTYDDYLRLPDDGRRYEIIKGVLYMANAPILQSASKGHPQSALF